MRVTCALLSGICLLATASAHGQSRTSTANGLAFTARSTIVGQNSTAALPSGGNPAYLAQQSRYNGVVALQMQFSNGETFGCTGSLLNNRRSIATAAHCVSDLTTGKLSGDLVRTSALFFDGAVTSDPNVFQSGDGVTSIDVSSYFVNPGYLGEVVDQNDIAVLNLSTLAPAFAPSYELYDGALTGQEFNVVGYGLRSLTGGDEGWGGDSLASSGRRRQGDNVYDFALGDSAFGGFFNDGRFLDLGTQKASNYFGFADPSHVYLSDFDNGMTANDASCRLGSFFGTSQFCSTGLGSREASIAPGDSGGPGFIGGRLASINSFILTLGPAYGDVDDDLSSSFGEFGGYVSVDYHRDFIRSAMGAVPEPSTWVMLILGFGVVGVSLRRRSGASKVAAVPTFGLLPA